MKTFFQIVSGLFLLAILSACGGGGGSAGTSMNGAALFTTAADKIQMLYGETKTFTVGGGVPSYSVSSSGAVSAKVSGTTLTIETTATGTGTVTVTDKVGTKVAIDVTVGTGAALSTTAPASVSVGVGAVTSKYFITGGTGVYAVNSSDTSIANVGMSDNIFVIGGVSTGTTTVVVKDNAGQSVSIAVTVIGGTRSLFTTAPSAVTVPSGKTVSYSISGGSAPYSVSSNNSGAADVSLKQNGTDFDINAIAAGAANIVVTDASRSSVTIAVTVTTPAAGTLSVLPAGASGSVGDTLKFNVVGGVLPYKVTNTNDSIALVTASSNGSSFTAALGNVGSTIVTIIDSLGTTSNITIVVNANASTLRLAPNAIEVSEQSVESFQLKIYGGSAPYTAFTSDPQFGLVSISGNTYTVAAPGGTNRRCVTTTTALGVYPVSLTVVDSLGASAVSIMSVRDTLDATCK
ncbi:hypothetical protein Undi14_02855 [Undibacterium sp. 14-3-2]|uniref:hypothetical protein n=1 Tax=Undibacterium sp. 14-3-2 TaxID=2800129 RepID=UPI0019051F0C|nr:hypothetical protein [Undibacterium sp. 14-3-2]MBK1888958.1 hypothetical protein [Undibacterium sp. 14-3-2]